MAPEQITVNIRARFIWWAKPVMFVAKALQSYALMELVVDRGILFEQQTSKGWKPCKRA